MTYNNRSIHLWIHQSIYIDIHTMLTNISINQCRKRKEASNSKRRLEYVSGQARETRAEATERRLRVPNTLETKIRPCQGPTRYSVAGTAKAYHHQYHSIVWIGDTG